jgi:hypothetical protein
VYTSHLPESEEEKEEEEEEESRDQEKAYASVLQGKDEGTANARTSLNSRTDCSIEKSHRIHNS